MRYFYDTEFLDDGKTIELISIGIVCEDGREYYAVNSDMGQKRISQNDWLMKNVVKHLPLHHYSAPRDGLGWIWSLDMKNTRIKPKWVIANEVRDFLLYNWVPSDLHSRPELWACYGAYDHVALAQLWGPMISLPKGIPMWTHELMQIAETSTGRPPAPPIDQHNALEDARWNKAFYEAMT